MQDFLDTNYYLLCVISPSLPHGLKTKNCPLFQILGVGVNVYYISVIILLESLVMNFYLLVVFGFFGEY